MAGGSASDLGKKRKTVLRTIRLGADVSEKMEAKAKASGSSVNSLLSSVITRYAEWDELAQRFGFMDVSKEFFRLYLETADEEKLKEITVQRQPAIYSDMMRFWFGEVSPDSFVKLLVRMSTYGWWLQVEPRIAGRDYVLIIRHEFDMKFSLFLRWTFESVVKSLFKATPQVEATASSLYLKFTVP